MINWKAKRKVVRRWNDDIGEYEDVLSMPPRCHCPRNTAGHDYDPDRCDNYLSTDPGWPIGDVDRPFSVRVGDDGDLMRCEYPAGKHLSNGIFRMGCEACRPAPTSDAERAELRTEIDPPLSVETLRHVVGGITYKTGWEFSVEVYDQFTGPFLVIRTVQPDSGDENGEVPLVIRSMIHPQSDVDRFIAWVLWRLTQAEIHEVQEFFKYDGVKYLDPHRELGA